MNAELKVTLAEVLATDPHERAMLIEGLTMQELSISAGAVDAACALWAALLGVPESEARAEVGDDAPMLVAMTLPAAEFLRWWRAYEWQDFPRSDGPAGDAWGWAVLDAARAGVARLGRMATQVPLTAAGVRSARQG